MVSRKSKARPTNKDLANDIAAGFDFFSERILTGAHAIWGLLGVVAISAFVYATIVIKLDDHTVKLSEDRSDIKVIKKDVGDLKESSHAHGVVLYSIAKKLLVDLPPDIDK